MLNFADTLRPAVNFRLALGIFVGAAPALIPVATAAAEWRTVAPLPSVRAVHAVAALNGKVYVAGGTDGVNKSLMTAIYDPITNSWSLAPSVGSQGSGIMDSYNGKLYFVGGCFNSDCYSPSNLLRIYNPLTGNWSDGAPAPSPRGQGGGAFVNGKLYVTGGVIGAVLNGELDIYDPSTNTWTIGAPLPTPRKNIGAVAIGGKFYVVGGGTQVADTNLVDAYDPATNAWSPDTPLPQPIQQGSASVVGGKVHYIGGNTNPSSTCVYQSTNYVFDPAAHVWSTAAPMPTARILMGTATVQQTIYVPGGLTCNGGNLTAVVEAFTARSPIEILISSLTSLVEGSDLAPQLKALLLSYIQQIPTAIASLPESRKLIAVEQLRSFINGVQWALFEGKITADKAKKLTELANEAIAVLT